MSLQNTFTLDVDFKKSTHINEPVVTQNDEVTFVLNIFDDDMEFDLSTVSTFTLVSLRPDKQSVMTLGTKTGMNQITFALGSTEISKVGKIDAAIQLYDVDGRVSTLPFTYQVLKDPVENYVPSENEQTLIELVLGQGPAIINAARQITEEATAAETLRNTAENNRATAESQRASAEASRVSAENERATNETARVDSENSRHAAETTRVQAEQERQTNTSTVIQRAEQATTNAINATEATELATTQAISARDDAQAVADNSRHVGEYNNETQYYKNNEARVIGSSYVAKQDTKGNPPPTPPLESNEFWELRAKKGVDGLGSVVSVNDIGPDESGNVEIIIPDPDLSGLATKEELQGVEDSIPKSTTHELTYYVNASTGDDTNDGLSATTAFKRIQKAVDSVPNNILHKVSIKVSAGVYNESLFIKNKYGHSPFEIVGASTRVDAVNYVVTGGIEVLNSSRVSLVGFKITGSPLPSGDGYITTGEVIRLDITKCILDGANNSYIAERGIQANSSTVYIYDSEISNMSEYAVYASINSMVISVANSGVNNNVVFGSVGSIIMKDGTQPSGTALNVEVFGGLISDNIARKKLEDWKHAVLQNGWSGVVNYKKDDLGLVTVIMSLGTGTVVNRTIIATLPLGYRPFFNFPTLVQKGNIHPYNADNGIIIESDGSIRILDPLASTLTPNSPNAAIQLTATFRIA